jgi:hypothetical protein
VEEFKSPIKFNQTLGSFRSGSNFRSNISHGRNASKPRIPKEAQGPQEPLTGAQLRKDVVDAFKKLKLDTYSDIMRIKQPHKSAVNAG